MKNYRVGDHVEIQFLMNFDDFLLVDPMNLRILVMLLFQDNFKMKKYAIMNIIRNYFKLLFFVKNKNPMSRFGFRTESTGTLNVRLNVVFQSEYVT